jgi:RND family efflux transporter MFP subunit
LNRVLLIAAACILIIFAALAVVIMLAMNRSQPETREISPAAMIVDAISAETSRDSFTVSAQGTVRPRTQTALAAEVGGRVIGMSEQFVAGGFFRAGDVLAEIDPSDYRAALLQAEADLASAQARLSDESARSDQARQDWQRLHGSSREPGDLVLRLPQVAGARAAVQAAEAAVLRARRNLERTRIRLPYDGMVRSRQVDLGQFVSPGSALGVTFAVDIAEIRLSLSDRDLAFLDLPAAGREDGPRPEVRLFGTVAGQRGEWLGQVVRTEGVIDEATRLTYAVVQVEDPYGLLGQQRQLQLIMGAFVQAEIRGRDASGLLVLPRSALREGDTLYLVDEDDRLEIRSVTVVRATPQHVYVHNDIQPSDRVITTAIQAPIPGMAVRVRDSRDPEPELRLLPVDDLADLSETDQ